MPDTTPVTPSTVATLTLLLFQVPPGVALVSREVLPTQALVVPPIGAGDALTVTVADIAQVFGRVYVILAVPIEMPARLPDGVIVATRGSLLVHIPLKYGFVYVVTAPAQAFKEPPMGPGTAFTVAILDVTHPAPDV
jgi:hypothetical protein